MYYTKYYHATYIPKTVPSEETNYQIFTTNYQAFTTKQFIGRKRIQPLGKKERLNCYNLMPVRCNKHIVFISTFTKR